MNTYTIDDAFTYIVSHKDIIESIDIEYNSKSFIQKAFYKTGKQCNRFVAVLKKPETKAAVLIANWAASASVLLLAMLFASSIIVVAASLMMFIIETYAVFGNVEYTVAYAMATRFAKDSVNV